MVIVFGLLLRGVFTFRLSNSVMFAIVTVFAINARGFKKSFGGASSKRQPCLLNAQPQARPLTNSKADYHGIIHTSRASLIRSGDIH